MARYIATRFGYIEIGEQSGEAAGRTAEPGSRTDVEALRAEAEAGAALVVGAEQTTAGGEAGVIAMAVELVVSAVVMVGGEGVGAAETTARETAEGPAGGAETESDVTVVVD